ncbi:histidine kinase [Algoriphagus sp. D3-2-R+10]|uniref:histidine kinase n=1 Tax=Algoriphagus aurantiacus TaxID=3103948 RepID=UPI002B3C4B9E|nr:histidine kinase [Algoriphagus sp. D3-2-R+10]MEB2776518.1 histidine kinase [Algoriphagus sp. D3-2-R+10]
MDSRTMDSRFVQVFFDWYTISADLLLIIGVICFIKLPKKKKADIHYWLPFLILVFTVISENMGAYTVYDVEFNKSVNAYLGNTEYPHFNLWLNNITKRQIGTILFLLLIKTWLEPSKRKYINWMIFIFIVLTFVLQFSGIESISLNQPIIFTIGANMILIGSGLYFIGMITHEQYLERNPLRLLSFWQMTFIMFTFTLTYICSVSLLYLYEVNYILGKSLWQIDMVMVLITLAILTLTVASPLWPGIFEKEPSYEFS